MFIRCWYSGLEFKVPWRAETSVFGSAFLSVLTKKSGFSCCSPREWKKQFILLKVTHKPYITQRKGTSKFKHFFVALLLLYLFGFHSFLLHFHHPSFAQGAQVPQVSHHRGLRPPQVVVLERFFFFSIGKGSPKKCLFPEDFKCFLNPCRKRGPKEFLVLGFMIVFHNGERPASRFWIQKKYRKNIYLVRRLQAYTWMWFSIVIISTFSNTTHSRLEKAKTQFWLIISWVLTTDQWSNPQLAATLGSQQAPIQKAVRKPTSSEEDLLKPWKTWTTSYHKQTATSIFGKKKNKKLLIIKDEAMEKKTNTTALKKAFSAKTSRDPNSFSWLKNLLNNNPKKAL